MADFPPSHTTGTGPPPPQSGRPYLDLTLAKSLPGLLKIAQIAVCFLTFCLCVSLSWWSNAGWSAFVCFVGCLGATFFFVLVVCHVVDLLPALPWEIIELVFYGVWTLLLFTAFCAMVTVASWGYGAAGAASFFLVVAVALFGLDTFLKFQAWRSAGGGVGGPPPVPDARSPA